ncbi:UNVERIFIED_CONTAM: hypothetical protein HDU68_006331 [Siphonaria sp. JEL0065]|nr:hypothetical protein HDU68_006331 [Siphonaria sp. JEL0065]
MASVRKTTFAHLPSDIIDEILVRVPLRSGDLVAFGLASKYQLAPFIFASVSFARRHVAHDLKVQNKKNLWKYLDSMGLFDDTWPQWSQLPLNYKAMLYREIMSQKDWAGDNVDYEEVVHWQNRYRLDLLYGPNLLRMCKRWPLTAPQRIEIMKILVEMGYSVASGWNYAIHMAAHANHLDVVEFLLLEATVLPLDLLNANANDNFLIRIASEMCRLKLVLYLLDSPIVDPRVNGNFCIRKAVEYGYNEIADVLLQDPRVDASVNNQYCLRKAIENRDIEMLMLLLIQHAGCIKPNTFIGTSCLKAAIQTKDFDIAAFLLDHVPVNLTANDCVFLKELAAHGHTDELTFLLEHEKVKDSLSLESMDKIRSVADYFERTLQMK